MSAKAMVFRPDNSSLGFYRNINRLAALGILGLFLVLLGKIQPVRAGSLLMSTDGTSSNNIDKARTLGHTVTTDTLANIILKSAPTLIAYNAVWINPSLSSSGYTTLRTGVQNGGALEQYARNGGTLIICVAGNNGNQSDIAPGGVDYDRSTTHESEVFSSPAHPYLTGAGYNGYKLTVSDFNTWSSTDHGQLQNLVAGSIVVLTNSNGPSWVEYGWGSGRVILNTLTYGWGSNGAKGNPQNNLINYACVPNIHDDLEITPWEGFLPAGHIGGPFSPDYKTYTLTNKGNAALNWSAAITQNWLDLSPLSGTLAAGASITLELSLNNNCAFLPAGSYSDTLAITNTNTLVKQTRLITLSVNPEETKITASDGAYDDQFGVSVAVSGNLAVVGAYYEDQMGSESGSAYVYEYAGNGWIQQAKLVASDGYSGDLFGYSVSISGDVILVGANGDDDKGSSSGSAYIFERTANGWVQTAKLVASDGASSDYFGGSVAIDGNAAIVGAYGKDENSVSDAGAAYVFERAGNGLWIQQAKLTAPDGYSGDQLGGAVAISEGHAIAGARLDDDKGSDSGSAYLYEKAGNGWVLQTKLNASDGYGGDQFGTSVCISENISMVGAPLDDDKGSNAGSAYIYGKFDALSVMAKIPPQDFHAVGYEEGPFDPTCKEYVLSNISAAPIDWTITINEPWLILNHSSGTLAPGASITVMLSLDPSVLLFPPGVYADIVCFENVTSGYQMNRQAKLEILNIPGEIEVQPAGVQFGDVIVGLSARKTVTLSNTSADHYLLVSGISLVPPFEGLEEAFPQTTLNPANWKVLSGAPTIDDVGIAEPSAPYSLRLNGNPSGGDSIESRVIDLSLQSDVKVSYWYQRTGGGEQTDPGEDLIISYWNGSAWVELDRQLGDGPIMSTYVQRILTLPANAYRPDFKLQIRSIGTSGAYDDWFVDNVAIASSDGKGQVAIVNLGYPRTDSGNRFDDLQWLRLENVPAMPFYIPPSGQIAFDLVFKPAELKTYDTTVTIVSDDVDESEFILPVSGAGIPEYLQITPDEETLFLGHPGGPFMPTQASYQITNTGPVSVDWTANAPEWLDVTPAQGPLAPQDSITVLVRPNNLANAFPKGSYDAIVTFVDETTTMEQTRPVTLEVYTNPKVWVDSTSLSDITIVQGENTLASITIGNTGGDSGLAFTMTGQLAKAKLSGPSSLESSVLTPQTMIPGKTDFKGMDFSALGSEAFRPGYLLVRFAPSADRVELSSLDKQAVLNRLGGGSMETVYSLLPGLCLVKLPAGLTVENALPLYNKDAAILYAQPDYEVHAVSAIPNDARFNDLWGMHNTGQSGGVSDADIDAPEAWDIAVGSHSVTVAVIDTGVDYNHPDLAANMWVNVPERDGTAGVDDDGNGYIDDIYGYDFCNSDSNPFDDNSHGTHCSGTIGAIGNNGVGVAGVCWNVKIMAVKFLDAGGSGYTSAAISSVQYATAMGVKVMSNSWGGGAFDQALKDAIDAAGAAGILFVVAAGNNSTNNDSSPYYPACYDSSNLIAVMATDNYDNRSSFSNYGPLSVDLGAPGSSILSCLPGNQYGSKNGTSMATPHVAGACALLFSMNPALSAQQVKDTLLQTVDKTLAGQCVSQGRLNLFNAVKTIPASSPFITFIPDKGGGPAGDSMNVGILFDGNQAPGTYTGKISIASNDPDYPVIDIPLSIAIQAADMFTELFDDAANDLSGRCLTFKPGGFSGYTLCLDEADAFPVDPSDGEILSLRDDDYREVNLEDKQIRFYDQNYETFYIASNGYITFGSGDTRHMESLANHFELPRISALFDDLDPSAGGAISLKKLDDRVVITYENVPEYGSSNTSSFQIELAYSGIIRITFLNVASQDGLVGLSRGQGLSPYYVESDLTSPAPCDCTGDFNRDSVVNLADYAAIVGHWLNQEELTETVADHFDEISYAGSNGSMNWSSDWTEMGESDGPFNGFIQVSPDGCLALGDFRFKAPPTCHLTRSLDIHSATQATLSYTYSVPQTSKLGYVSVQISSDGVHWTTLAAYTPESGSGSEQFDITGFISANMKIRFEVGSQTRLWMYAYIDNIQIQFNNNSCPWYPWDACDLNQDFVIDTGDLTVFCEHWLR